MHYKKLRSKYSTTSTSSIEFSRKMWWCRQRLCGGTAQCPDGSQLRAVTRRFKIYTFQSYLKPLREQSFRLIDVVSDLGIGQVSRLPAFHLGDQVGRAPEQALGYIFV